MITDRVYGCHCLFVAIWPCVPLCVYASICLYLCVFVSMCDREHVSCSLVAEETNESWKQ